MTSVRKFEQEIWRSLAVYVNRGDTAALIEQEDAAQEWSGADWDRFERACRNVFRRASRYGGMTLVDR
jgi:hypothetical protein